MVKKEPNVQFKGRDIGRGEAGQSGAGRGTTHIELNLGEIIGSYWWGR